MPFKEAHVVDIRERFVVESYRTPRSFSAVCDRYGISRNTGYKWRRRYAAGGRLALEDQARIPNSCPWATPAEVVEAILKVRRTYPDYGAKKIAWYLERHRPELPLPSLTTIHNILTRHDLVLPRRPRMRRWHPGRPLTRADEPNESWTIDYKGEFRLGDGLLCYPLTTKDLCSRMLLGCKGLTSTKTVPAKQALKRLFQTYGLPLRIRSDNGTPFASNALGRLSTLSVWLIQLGVRPELIEPASPYQNGSHENMHIHLKRRTARKPRANLRAQQRAFDSFRSEYNTIRPHEALGGLVPADLYRPSPRPFPKTLAPITYPEHFVIRRVSTNGGIRWMNHWVNVSHLLAELPIGFEEVDHGLFDVFFGPVWLGQFVEAKRRIVDAHGRVKRNTKIRSKRP
jgi:transposase InsO family protein